MARCRTVRSGIRCGRSPPMRPITRPAARSPAVRPAPRSWTRRRSKPPSSRIGADDSVEWYFTVADTNATATPAGGAAVGRVGQVALPVLKTYPALTEGATRPVTHLQVLLPSGKSGWIPLSAARPMVTDRLCYALTADGTWKIAAFDAAE